MICDNLDGIGCIILNVFLERSVFNDLIDCFNLKVVNLNEWKEGKKLLDSLYFFGVMYGKWLI